MSDEQMPVWAREMENRLGSRLDTVDKRLEAVDKRLDTVDKRLDTVDTRLNGMESRVDADRREHHLLEEVGKAISDSGMLLAQRIAELRAEMMRRFDRVHDDLTVNLARADVAIERVQRLEGDVRMELSQLQRRLRELEHWRDHRPDAGQPP